MNKLNEPDKVFEITYTATKKYKMILFAYDTADAIKTEKETEKEEGKIMKIKRKEYENLLNRIANLENQQGNLQYEPDPNEKHVGRKQRTNSAKQRFTYRGIEYILNVQKISIDWNYSLSITFNHSALAAKDFRDTFFNKRYLYSDIKSIKTRAKDIINNYLKDANEVEKLNEQIKDEWGLL